jgi:hypothetical protein
VHGGNQKRPERHGRITGTALRVSERVTAPPITYHQSITPPVRRIPVSGAASRWKRTGKFGKQQEYVTGFGMWRVPTAKTRTGRLQKSSSMTNELRPLATEAVRRD